jgi:hypothetical protein
MFGSGVRDLNARVGGTILPAAFFEKQGGVLIMTRVAYFPPAQWGPARALSCRLRENTMDIDRILRGAVELEYEKMREIRHHSVDQAVLAWERAMAVFRSDPRFAMRNLALYDRGYALIKAIVAHCAEWPGPAKALADAAILRCDITTHLGAGDKSKPVKPEDRG